MKERSDILTLGTSNFKLHTFSYKVMQGIANALAEAVFPSKCLICRSFFRLKKTDSFRLPGRNLKRESLSPLLKLYKDKDKRFDLLMAPFLCVSCRQGYLPVESPVCSKCGIMFKSRQGEDHMCQECIENPKEFEIARGAGIYDQSLMTLIHRFKYNGKLQLAKPLGMLLFAAFVDMFDLFTPDIIVPVPLHIQRFRKRGFNQAYLLIKQWDRLADITGSIPSPFRIEKGLLVRSGKTKSQTGLDRKKRISNIKGAFSLRPNADVSGKRVLLVDDVYTTGATANECARVLLKGDARKVTVLTLARAMR
jgi:ComF family protein